MHGFSCYYLTIKLQTSAWLTCKFFVDNYFIVLDVQNKPVSLQMKFGSHTYTYPNCFYFLFTKVHITHFTHL